MRRRCAGALLALAVLTAIATLTAALTPTAELAVATHTPDGQTVPAGNRVTWADLLTAGLGLALLVLYPLTAAAATAWRQPR